MFFYLFLNSYLFAFLYLIDKMAPLKLLSLASASLVLFAAADSQGQDGLKPVEYDVTLRKAVLPKFLLKYLEI